MAMTKTIQATVKNRTDTAANWTQKNPVLAEGEIIVVQTSAGETRLKIGDGVKTFTQLPYTDEQIYNNVVTSVNGQTGDVTLDIPGGGADWAQNDPDGDGYVKNRPGGYLTDPVITDADAFTITSADGGDGVYMTVVAVESSDITLSDYVIGDGVIVDFGGQSYSLTWQLMEGFPACGAAVTGAAPDWSAAPFCIIAAFGEKGSLEAYYIYLQNAVTSPIQVKIKKAKQTPIKIPTKYLESDVYIVKVTGKSNEQRPGVDGADVSYDVTVSATYDDIVAAVNAGKIPILLGEPVLRDPVLRLVDIDTDTVDGATPKLTFGGAYFWQSDRLYGTCVVIYRTGEATCCRYDSSFVNRLKDVDSAMSSTSFNPVQNRVIKKYVDDHTAGSQSLGLKSAAVGQIAKITAVDESGVPTAWSPADMPSGGSSDFIIAGTLTETTGLTLDKTFDQIQEAIRGGKLPIIRLEAEGPTITLPVVSNTSGIIMFSGSYSAEGQIMSISVMVTNSGADYTSVTTPATNPNRTMKQISMDANPTTDMQIATKKYVDDNTFNTVLYTAQTLTDEQRRQARDNIEAAANDFVINATLAGSDTCTLDKTYAQIREAVQAGNNPVVHFADPGTSGTVFMPLTLDFGSGFVFRVTFSIDDNYQSVIGQYTISALQDGRVIFGSTVGLSLDSDGNLHQVTMANDPKQPMQIATKQYVDAQAGDFIVTATLSDDTNCTLDKTFDQIQEAIHGGKRVLARLSTGLSAYMPLVLYNSEALFFGATTITYDSIEVYTLTVGKNVAKFVDKSAVTYNSNSAMPQVSMAAAPTEDMQIATKKYVDDKISDKELILSSSTAGSTKKFKLTIDDTGTLTASEITA